MSYYQRHVFFCVNQRSDGRKCCADFGGQELRDYAKKRIKDLNMAGRGRVRVNMAGCLDRCGFGPVAVVYPEGVWYRFDSKKDVDELIESHLLGGELVDRLMID